MKHHRVDQNSDVWFSLRHGMPTGSKASCLVTGTGKLSATLKEYAEELAMNTFAGKSLNSFNGNSSTQRGHDLEPVAADYYAFVTDREPVVCGFYTDDLERYGASPDRTVGDDGLIEIKCQESKGHLKTLLAYQKTGKPSVSFYPQMQMQLMVTERKWLDLVLYHPDLPSSICRIEPDAEFQKKLKLQITACIQHRDDIIKSLQEIAA